MNKKRPLAPFRILDPKEIELAQIRGKFEQAMMQHLAAQKSNIGPEMWFKFSRICQGVLAQMDMDLSGLTAENADRFFSRMPEVAEKLRAMMIEAMDYLADKYQIDTSIPVALPIPEETKK